ncbi:MAG: DinB family protein [Actinomycetota bacterium]
MTAFPLPEKPPVAAPERDMLSAFLDYQRGIMLRKADGLDDEPLRRAMTPSALTLLGLVKHLTWVERWWFRVRFAGEHIEDPWTEDDPDGDFRIEPHETTAEILAGYRDECERSRKIVASAELDDEAAVEARGRRVTMRWILLHMIEETARHLGHADLMREQVDGATGD